VRGNDNEPKSDGRGLTRLKHEGRRDYARKVWAFFVMRQCNVA
jgi:hypothetical protein